jgi:hypothetical protein
MDNDIRGPILRPLPNPFAARNLSCQDMECVSLTHCLVTSRPRTTSAEMTLPSRCLTVLGSSACMRPDVDSHHLVAQLARGKGYNWRQSHAKHDKASSHSALPFDDLVHSTIVEETNFANTERPRLRKFNGVSVLPYFQQRTWLAHCKLWGRCSLSSPFCRQFMVLTPILEPDLSTSPWGWHVHFPH